MEKTQCLQQSNRYFPPLLMHVLHDFEQLIFVYFVLLVTEKVVLASESLKYATVVNVCNGFNLPLFQIKTFL